VTDEPGARGEPAEPGAVAASGRPLVERLGLGAIALVLAAVFAFVCLAAWTSGEVFLAVMAGIGALMTMWAAAATLRRG
jgi:hypothetical protein